MKFKLLSILLLSAFTISFSSCFNCEEGSGKIASSTMELSEFDEIVIDLPADVFIKQGNKNSIEIRVDKNLLEFIETKVKRNTLRIKTEKCISKYKVFDIHITAENFDKIELNGSGNVKNSGTLKLEELKIELNGSGKADFKIETVDLETEINGSGEIKYKGYVKNHEIEISGSGKIKAYKLDTKNTEVEISGSGSCKVKVSNKLKAKITGSGNVYYKGNIKKLDTDISGSGKVISEK